MNPTILMVEDSSDDSWLIERAFRKSEFPATFQLVPHGEEAIDYLTASGRFVQRDRCILPSLIISDIKMPRMGGLELLQWVRSKPVLKTIPFVVFSASKEPNDLKLAYEFGANSFLVKPGSFDELVEEAKLLKLYWLKFNQVCY